MRNYIENAGQIKCLSIQIDAKRARAKAFRENKNAGEYLDSTDDEQFEEEEEEEYADCKETDDESSGDEAFIGPSMLFNLCREAVND